MVAFKKYLSSVLLAVLYASYGDAAPWPTNAKHATHSVRTVGSGVQINVFHPKADYKTFGAGVDVPPSFVELGIEDKTVQTVSSQLNLDSTKVAFKSGYTQEGQSFGYARQSHDGVPFVNAVANVAFKDNRLVAFGQSFVDTSKIADSKPTVDVNTVIPKVEDQLQGKINEIKPSVEYLALQDGTVSLVHVFQVQNLEAGTWYEAYVDAHSGELVSVTDFRSDGSYRVLPIFKKVITQGLELLTDPQNPASSPDGWHSDGTTTTTDTFGNNVVAFKGGVTNTTSQSSDGLVFDYTYDTTKEPTDSPNVDAARTNAFYLINSYHDTLYQYGFTEQAFNFQNNNFDKGGLGNDRVNISVQDSSGTDNANFFTPPDGQSGLCRMYIWDLTAPKRDGSLENDIPLHEMTHGLTNRMTGGGTARCLQTVESGGMGEGWSDALADWFAHSASAEITDMTMGPYVANNPAGIRTHPYSTSVDVNPLRYSDVATRDEVHDIGEVSA
ncbi:hypothetical protein E1B28_005258 [Marasmius oreades]|uniref:Extracellular metalloproteinase n=1 Tax=Marasmius oreades TaxID=181124 RepID=A0A9P8ADT9_9AGAR|nr:uncharacterized protein E1B28_005258 [Marasmius oreades]KAG7097947.1 hypothetical protein E1B28_005258 [Marasmius oreades]